MLSPLIRLLRRPRDERGSLIVALAIILVLSVLCAAIVAEVTGNQQNVVNRQNLAGSVAGANAGMSDALFRLDQGSTYEGSGSEFYVKSTISPSACSSDSPRCVGTSIPGAPNVSYVARQSSATKWVVQSEAVTNRAVSAVQETVTRTTAYPFALFGNQGLNFNGFASVAFGTYSSSNLSSATNPDTSTSDCTNGTGTSCVAIGSNGTISCPGGLGSNVTSVYYSGGGGISGSCGTADPVSSVYKLTTPSSPMGAYFACPNNGLLGSNQTVTGTVAGVNAPLPSGTYLCSNQQVVINGNMSVSGPVTIDIILDSATNTSMVNSGTPTLDIKSGSYVNVSTAITTTPPAANVSLPDATLLTIASNSTGTVGDSTGQGYWYGGVLDAPDASLVGNGCKSVYFGSTVINTLTCNGGPHLTVYYDSLLTSVYGPWQTSGYQQINPSSVTIP